MQNSILDNLITLDLANNHNGDLKHGIEAVKQFGDVCNNFDIKCAIKYQFRNIDTFIHKDYLNRDDIPHIPWFKKSYLSNDDYHILTDEIKKQNFVTMATPFDEDSIPLIKSLDLDIIKIASCSFRDKPLVDAVSKLNKPVIASTAGASLKEIDHVVQVFESQNLNFALMHCVAIYPTPSDKFNLNQIKILKNRYPDINIGWSTHEDPNDIETIKLAYAFGARIFERHVGLKTDKYDLNKYSSTPEQIKDWLDSYIDIIKISGPENRPPSIEKEQKSLESLMRGIYLKNNIKANSVINSDDVYFAMPIQENQCNSGQWSEGLISDKDYKANEALSKSVIPIEAETDSSIIYDIMLQVKGMLNDARIPIGKNSEIEISHHYGLKRFREFGAVIINIFNRTYCKKLIIQLPRQKHPYHYHKRKEESFQVLYGNLSVEKDGYTYNLDKGDTLQVNPKEWHKFSTLNGVIFEEVSTRHYNDDSFYEDIKIAKLDRDTRKTYVDNWEVI